MRNGIMQFCIISRKWRRVSRLRSVQGLGPGGDPEAGPATGRTPEPARPRDPGSFLGFLAEEEVGIFILNDTAEPVDDLAKEILEWLRRT